MKNKKTTTVNLIAPCGINCGVCIAYLREKKKCPGCQGSDENKSYSCVNCRIKNCHELIEHTFKFCFQCHKFPCERIQHMDKRYRIKYHMSVIDNLQNIEKSGIRTFVNNEKKRWECAFCGGAICVHRGCCFICGKQKILSSLIRSSSNPGVRMILFSMI